MPEYTDDAEPLEQIEAEFFKAPTNELGVILFHSRGGTPFKTRGDCRRFIADIIGNPEFQRKLGEELSKPVDELAILLGKNPEDVTPEEWRIAAEQSAQQ